MSKGLPHSDSHHRRHELNQFRLEASLLENEPGNGTDLLRQLERLESLNLRLKAIESDLKFQCDPDWLESVIRVLVLEDADGQPSATVDALRKNGFFVATACTGDQAVNYLYRAVIPDVVLIDLPVSERDGHDTATVIRYLPFAKPVKVVAVSGTDANSDELSPFDAHLRKPVDIDHLIRTIKDAAGNNLQQ